MPSQRRGKGSLSDQQREGLVAAASTLLEDDEERYIIKGTGDLAGMLDYFTEYGRPAGRVPPVLCPQKELVCLTHSSNDDIIIELYMM